MNNAVAPLNSHMQDPAIPSLLPPVFSEFDWAIVRIVVFAEPRPPKDSPEPTKPLTLVFATVTLLSAGRQLPPNLTEIQSQPLGDKQGVLHFNLITMRAADALAWYRSPVQALCTPVRAENFSDHDGEPLVAGRLEDLPAWPILGVPMLSNELIGTNWSVPAIPYEGTEIARYHRRLDGSQEWSSLDPHSLGARLLGSPNALTFLERNAHVNFAEYPEYLGSLSLVVPDSIVRSIDHFVEATAQGGEKICLRIVPRPGKSLEGLSIVVMEGNSSMLTAFETREVPMDGAIEIARTHTIDSSGMVLTHRDFGVLLHEPMSTFLRSVNVGIEVAEAGSHIDAPDTEAKRSPITRYRVTEFTPASQRVVGDRPPPSSAAERVRQAQVEREYRKDARRYDQTWFEGGQRRQALEHLRGRVQEARARLIIADPYFGATQVWQLLYAVQRASVHITILTSREAFESKFAEDEENEQVERQSEANQLVDKPASAATPIAETKRAKADAKLLKFANAMKLCSERLGNRTEVWIAGPAEGHIHDRFLAVDERVWSLGSSVNMLGVRPTMVLRVPHAEVVRTHLGRLLTLATSLDAYVEMRLKKTSKGVKTNAV